jgi:hypothetical protein
MERRGVVIRISKGCSHFSRERVLPALVCGFICPLRTSHSVSRTLNSEFQSIARPRFRFDAHGAQTDQQQHACRPTRVEQIRAESRTTSCVSRKCATPCHVPVRRFSLRRSTLRASDRQTHRTHPPSPLAFPEKLMAHWRVGQASRSISWSATMLRPGSRRNAERLAAGPSEDSLSQSQVRTSAGSS